MNRDARRYARLAILFYIHGKADGNVHRMVDMYRDEVLHGRSKAPRHFLSIHAFDKTKMHMDNVAHTYTLVQNFVDKRITRAARNTPYRNAYYRYVSLAAVSLPGVLPPQSYWDDPDFCHDFRLVAADTQKRKKQKKKAPVVDNIPLLTTHPNAGPVLKELEEETLQRQTTSAGEIMYDKMALHLARNLPVPKLFDKFSPEVRHEYECYLAYLRDHDAVQDLGIDVEYALGHKRWWGRAQLMRRLTLLKFFCRRDDMTPAQIGDAWLRYNETLPDTKAHLKKKVRSFGVWRIMPSQRDLWESQLSRLEYRMYEKGEDRLKQMVPDKAWHLVPKRQYGLNALEDMRSTNLPRLRVLTR